MALTADQKEFVAWLVLMFNPLHGLLKKLSRHVPEGWEVLPYLINFLIAATAVFFIIRYSSPHRKFTFWLIPVIVSGLALVTYLRW